MLASPSPAIAQPFSHGKAGVGLFFQEEKKELVVRNIVPGGSAEANGSIKPGDIIIGVDGKSVEGQGIEMLRDCIIGNIGTFVELSFLRPSPAHTDSPNIYSVVLERKSQTKTVPGPSNHPADAAPLSSSSNSSSAVDSGLDVQKLHRRVSNLTFEKADLQSLLDQKNAQAEARQKTIEVLETQLQSTIAENERLTRESEFAKTRERQALSDKSSKDSSLASELADAKAQRDSIDNELQRVKKELLEQSALLANGRGLVSTKQTENERLEQALSAAQNELSAMRSSVQADSGSKDELQAAKEANARLSADNASIRGEPPRANHSLHASVTSDLQPCSIKQLQRTTLLSLLSAHLPPKLKRSAT